MNRFSPLILLTLLLAACTKPTNTADVQTMNRQFIQAWNNRETDKVVGLLADSVQFLQGETRFVGKAEVAQKWVRSTMPTITNLKTNTVSTVTDSQIAYEAGTYSVDVLPATPAEPRGIGEGNFMLLWKKGADNAWKLSYAQLEGLPVQVRR